MNADGLPDIAYNGGTLSSLPNGATSYPADIQLNNGAGFDPVNNIDWKFPIMRDGWGQPYKITGTNSLLGDYNGDGVLDILNDYDTQALKENPLFFGSGRGTWTEDVSSWGAFKVGAGAFSSNQIFIPQIDINSDGLIDFYNAHSSSDRGPDGVFMNTGEGFIDNHPDYSLAALSALDLVSSHHPYADINADGLIDSLSQSGNAGEVTANIAQGMVPDYLIGVMHSSGATTDITYKPSTHYKDTNGDLLNPNLPMIVQTAHQITTNDNNGMVATITYEYADGYYYYQDAFDRRFAGFGRVTATDALGQDLVTYYHQGNGQQGSEPPDPTDGSQIGKVWKTERFDDQSNLMATTETTWASSSLGNDRYFVRPTQSMSDQDGKITTTTRTYNTTTGNLDTETVAFNDAQGYTDTTTAYTYTSGALQLPATITVTNGGNDWSKTRLYYDNLTIFGATNGVNGNMTKQSVWDGTNWIDSTYTYDTSGNVLTETDPKSNTTTYVYDTYDIYPALVTNAENHATNYSYNYAVGQPTTITDPNLNQTTFTYDGLGRTLTTKRNGTTLQSAQYIDVANPYAITTTHYDGATYDTYTYMDGLGRTIQTKTDLAPTIYATTDTVYDELGRVITQSLPYDSTTLAPTPANINTSLNIFTDYDALDRPDVITDATGQINYFYNGWGTTVNDKNSINKTLSYNGQGNLIQVIENNNGSAYTTSYAYNPNGNLTWINDAQSNQRSFGYDKLGRREYATDGGSGTHTYAYDNNGNVLTWTTPNADVITYTYDDLNRIETEDSNSTAGVDVTYIYDQGTNGTGHLTQAISQGVTTDYTYDAFDHLASESRTIAGTSYVTTYANDRQGIPTQIIYPDGTDIDYTYYNEGLVNTITLDNTTPLVTLSLYNANRQLTQQFGSAAGTLMNTYDDNQLYRLTNRTIAGVQDITYTYDNNGNVLTITDQSAGTIAKLSTFTYDDLNRLSTATITNSANNQDYTYTYTYSATGNILTAGGDTYTYAGVHPQAVSDINGVTYTYDPNGNATTIDTDTFDYNYKNQLTEATVTTGSGSSGNGGGGTTPTMGDIIRTTEYIIPSGTFTGSTHTLTLDQDLSSDYLVMVRGGSTYPGTRGANADAARVISDPHGNFATISGTNQLELERGSTIYDWQGVVTVIECLAECDTNGFTLEEVAEVTLPTGTANALQTVTHTFATPHTGQTAIITTGEVSSASTIGTDYGVTRGARITPTGTNDITIERYGAQARVPAEMTQTLFNLQFGSAWDIEAVSIDAWTSFGDGVDAPSEYTSATLSQTYTTDNTFTLTTSYSDKDGIGDGALGIVTTLGAGGTTVPNQTNLVSVASEHAGTRHSTVTVLSHPDLSVQHLFKPDGDTGATGGNQTLTYTLPTSVTPDATVSLLTTTVLGTGQAYPRTGAWSSYVSDPTTVSYTRPQQGQPFVAWLSVISWDDFQDVLLTGGGTSGGGTGGGSTSNNVIRTTDYVIPDGSYPNEDYALTLDQDLTDNYVIMINGGSTYPGTRGAYMDAVRVTADPHGNFATTTASNQVTLTRGSTAYDWRGVITVIECLTDCTTDGFTLAEVAEVDLPTGTANTLQTVTHTFATPHTGQTAIIKGGESTSDPAVGTFYGVTRGARITTAGTNDITIERFGAQSRVPSPLTLTLYNLEFGSA
jgi:YD repeat-containing protein